jgi:heavy metal efflux system protein
MIKSMIEHALRHRWLVLIFVVAVAGAGVWSFTKQPIDAYPDISSQMVQVITTYPGRAPEDVERQVTIPIENAMLGTPRVEVVRSRTIFGLSLVQLTFEEGTESYWARQRVMEKLAEVDLPDGVKPDMGPLATAYGEIYRYELVSDGTHDLMELRELNDWVVTRRLKRVPGIAEAANFGGLEKQFAVTFYPAQLERYGLTLGDMEDAIKKNNAAAGGSVVTRGSMSLVVRGGGMLETIKQIESIFVKSIDGTPIYLRDVASVGLDNKVPNGIFSKDATDSSVSGIITLRKGENPSLVLEELKKAIKDLNDSELPPGVRIVPYYDRTQLVKSTLDTVQHSVLLGITLVVIVLLLFLGRPSMAALVALTIPFSLLFALVLMYATDIPIGLLSIGAIDFGIIVDGAVIVAENIARRLGETRGQMPRPSVGITVLRAILEVERSVFFSILMIMAAYLPLLSLTSIEGLLFRPMALTMVYSLIGALIFALFVVPVLATILFRNGYVEWDNPVLHLFRRLYAIALRVLLRGRWLVVAVVVAGVAVVVVKVVPKLGFEFLPYMDEGVIWVRANYAEGTSLEQTSEYGRRLREIALEFEDIDFVIVQAGRNDDGTDPFPPSRIEMMVGPKPRQNWKQFETKQQLIAALGARYREEFPTTRFNFTQPIIDSVTEDTNGTSANLAVEFSGPNSEILLDLARQTVELLKGIRGATDVSIEQEGPQPQLVITPDRDLCARYNVRIEDVTKLVNMAIGGEAVGNLYEGERKFDIVARLDKQSKESTAAIGRLPVHTADGIPIPLSQVASIAVIDGQTLIARENSRRRITVRCDVVGRDQGGFVAEAQERFAEKITMPEGYHPEWLGMFQNLDRAKKHFMRVMPITVGLIFILLLVTFRSIKSALLLLLSVPFAFIGGVVALKFREMNLNVSTGVGFAALFGVSIMNGVLMVRSIAVLRNRGLPMREAIVQGARDCLRPILLASIVAILGLLPASLASGLGSDVQRPLATVIVWGLFSSTVLTLFVVPILFDIFAPRVSRTASGA